MKLPHEDNIKLFKESMQLVHKSIDRMHYQLTELKFDLYAILREELFGEKENEDDRR